MQVLITTGVFAAANSAAVYLPYDAAPIPFGDPLVATMTNATGTVVTIPGYQPATNDALSFSYSGAGASLIGTQVYAGSLASTFNFNVVYYATPTSTSAPWTFTLSTRVSGSGVTSVSNWLTAVTGSQSIVAHLLSNQSDGPKTPFKTGATVLAMNLPTSAFTTTNQLAITLFGTNDVSSILATAPASGFPMGPNGSATTGWSVIATIGAGQPKLISLNYDWIVASGSTNTLVLIQN